MKEKELIQGDVLSSKPAFFVPILTWRRSFLIVTDKRVYGRVGLFRRFDLPLDSITAVLLKDPFGITLSTSSKVIRFNYLSNCYQVYKVISALISETTKNDLL